MSEYKLVIRRIQNTEYRYVDTDIFAPKSQVARQAFSSDFRSGKWRRPDASSLLQVWQQHATGEEHVFPRVMRCTPSSRVRLVDALPTTFRTVSSRTAVFENSRAVTHGQVQHTMGSCRKLCFVCSGHRRDRPVSDLSELGWIAASLFSLLTGAFSTTPQRKPHGWCSPVANEQQAEDLLGRSRTLLYATGLRMWKFEDGYGPPTALGSRIMFLLTETNPENHKAVRVLAVRSGFGTRFTF